MKWAWEIKWTESPGVKMRVESDFHNTEVEAKKEAVEIAKRFGWTPPRWWQWWRWSDTRLNAIAVLFLTLATALAVHDPGNIALWGNYDSSGYYRSDPVLAVGASYTFKNNGTELVSVVVMPGQNLAGIEPGQTVAFVAQGEWLLIYSPFERGDPLLGLKLTKIAP